MGEFEKTRRSGIKAEEMRIETAASKAFSRRKLVGRKRSAAPELPPQQKVDPRIAAARARGRALLQKMKRAEGGAISADKAARLLHIKSPHDYRSSWVCVETP